MEEVRKKEKEEERLKKHLNKLDKEKDALELEKSGFMKVKRSRSWI